MDYSRSLNTHQRNLRTLSRCQAAWDRMQPPEYYEQEEEVIDPVDEFTPAYIYESLCSEFPDLFFHVSETHSAEVKSFSIYASKTWNDLENAVASATNYSTCPRMAESTYDEIRTELRRQRANSNQ